MKRFVFVPALVLLAACSGNGGEIDVTAATAPLTDNGGDALFTLKLSDAREEGYSLTGFHVRVTPDDTDTAIDVSCTAVDANANQKLDSGDSLTCVEGVENKLGKSLAGKDVDIELFAEIDGEEESVADATWTAK